MKIMGDPIGEPFVSGPCAQNRRACLQFERMPGGIWHPLFAFPVRKHPCVPGRFQRLPQ